MWRSQVAVWCLLFVMATPVWAQRPGGDGGGAGVDMATVMFASLAAAALALLGCLWWLRRHYAAMDARAQAKEHAVVRRIEVAEAGAAVAMGGCVVEVPRTSTQQRAFVLAQWTSVHPPMLTPPFDDTPAKQQAKPPRLMRTVAFPVNTWRKRQTLIRKVSPADFKSVLRFGVCDTRGAIDRRNGAGGTISRLMSPVTTYACNRPLHPGAPELGKPVYFEIRIEERLDAPSCPTEIAVGFAASNFPPMFMAGLADHSIALFTSTGLVHCSALPTLHGHPALPGETKHGDVIGAGYERVVEPAAEETSHTASGGAAHNPHKPFAWAATATNSKAASSSPPRAATCHVRFFFTYNGTKLTGQPCLRVPCRYVPPKRRSGQARATGNPLHTRKAPPASRHLSNNNHSPSGAADFSAMRGSGSGGGGGFDDLASMEQDMMHGEGGRHVTARVRRAGRVGKQDSMQRDLRVMGRQRSWGSANTSSGSDDEVEAEVGTGGGLGSHAPYEVEGPRQRSSVASRLRPYLTQLGTLAPSHHAALGSDTDTAPRGGGARLCSQPGMQALAQGGARPCVSVLGSARVRVNLQGPFMWQPTDAAASEASDGSNAAPSVPGANAGGGKGGTGVVGGDGEVEEDDMVAAVITSSLQHHRSTTAGGLHGKAPPYGTTASRFRAADVFESPHDHRIQAAIARRKAAQRAERHQAAQRQREAAVAQHNQRIRENTRRVLTKTALDVFAQDPRVPVAAVATHVALQRAHHARTEEGASSSTPVPSVRRPHNESRPSSQADGEGPRMSRNTNWAGFDVDTDDDSS